MGGESDETGRSLTTPVAISGVADNGVISGDEDANYICPMMCVPPGTQPGKCPVCGMDLVKAANHSHGADDPASAVQLADAQIVAAGIRVAPVERKFVSAEIRLFGKIEYDPVEQYKVTAFAPGVIDRIYVKRAGQTVRAGDPLFDINSAELFFLEQELFDVLKVFPDTLDYRPARGQRYRRLMRPATRSFTPPKGGKLDPEKKVALENLEQIKRKMMLLGLTNKDIEAVMAKGRPSGISTVTTPTTGVVLEQSAYKGTFVNTGDLIFTIANPKYKWARLEAYESDYPWLRIGQEAEFFTDALPGQTFKGSVLFLDTEFDPQTKTYTVGVLYQDEKRRLKPNMLVRCTLKAAMSVEGVALPKRKSKATPPLVIPETAPLITGNRAVVYVEDSSQPGRYEAREIILGPRAKGYYVVKHGVLEGEWVVVAGNFKIDSTIQILAKSSMMAPSKKPHMNHHGADMDGPGEMSGLNMDDPPHQKPAMGQSTHHSRPMPAAANSHGQPPRVAPAMPDHSHTHNMAPAGMAGNQASAPQKPIFPIYRSESGDR